MDTVYLDNAATSFPKPAGMSARMKDYMDNIGATINRSVYASAADAGLVALSLRERAKRFFNFNEKATHVIITPGATAGLNFIIKGLLRAGEHCIVSSMEHNAVMRPLMQPDGVEFSRIPCDGEGRIIPNTLEPLIRPNTRLVIMAHGSNVCGTVQDAKAVGEVCKKHNIPFALDAAQTAGHYPVDFDAFNLSALAVPGHKGLLGPAGIGLLLLSDRMAHALDPLIAGGTGSASDKETLPDYLPDRFESGTPNMAGIYGLEYSLGFVEGRGIEALRAHELALTKRFIDGLDGIANVRLCGTQQLCQRGAALVQRERQQDAVRPRHLFGPAHRTARPFQRPACRRLPGIGAHDRKLLCLHAVPSPFPLCAILCRKMEIRERDDFECAPRCSAHLQRKKDFKFQVSGKSADFPETHFHGKGLGR